MKLQHTPAPWRWELNEKSKHVELVGGIPKYDLTVMSFVRYGMGSAAPEFRDSNCIMKRCEAFGKEVEGRKHHADWFKSISHPDAKLMQSAPEMIDCLLKIEKFISENKSKNYMIEMLSREVPELSALINKTITIEEVKNEKNQKF